jgi:3-deoxy-D-manno-octulosonate 8-phosphate phosphatase (KDO 8-P phosphatase)
MNVLERFSSINTLIFDMDGVLTDGSLWVFPGNEWIRKMNIKDGYALQLAVKHGYTVMIVSGSSSTPVAERLEKLGIKNIYQKVFNKKSFVIDLMQKFGKSAEEVLFMGDDNPDLPLLQWVGLSCCPSDAVRDVIENAHFITLAKGGEGCVREIVEKLMRLQKKWNNDFEVASI